MKFCTRCGMQLDDNAAFCSRCGFRQPIAKSVNTQQPPPVPQGNIFAANMPQDARQIEPTDMQQPQPAQPQAAGQAPGATGPEPQPQWPRPPKWGAPLEEQPPAQPSSGPEQPAAFVLANQQPSWQPAPVYTPLPPTPAAPLRPGIKDSLYFIWSIILIFMCNPLGTPLAMWSAVLASTAHALKGTDIEKAKSKLRTAKIICIAVTCLDVLFALVMLFIIVLYFYRKNTIGFSSSGTLGSF